MAQTRYSQLPQVTGLDGTEIVPLDQSDGEGGYVTRRTTTGAIAALGFGVLSNYVDDAAAALGGVPLGGFYRTASVVKVRVS